MRDAATLNMDAFVQRWVASMVRRPDTRLPYLWFPERVELAAFTCAPWAYRETIGRLTQCVIIEDRDLTEDTSIFEMMRTSVLYIERAFSPNHLHWVQVGGLPPVNMHPLRVEGVSSIDISNLWTLPFENEVGVDVANEYPVIQASAGCTTLDAAEQQARIVADTWCYDVNWSKK